MADLRKPPDGETIRKTILQRGVTWPWMSDENGLADSGVIGDPKAATVEYGRQIMDRAVETAGAVLRQLLHRQRA